MHKVRTVRIHKFGGPEALKVEDIELSMPDAEEVLVADVVVETGERTAQS